MLKTRMKKVIKGTWKGVPTENILDYSWIARAIFHKATSDSQLLNLAFNRITKLPGVNPRHHRDVSAQGPKLTFGPRCVNVFHFAREDFLLRSYNFEMQWHVLIADS